MRAETLETLIMWLMKLPIQNLDEHFERTKLQAELIKEWQEVFVPDCADPDNKPVFYGSVRKIKYDNK